MGTEATSYAALTSVVGFGAAAFFLACALGTLFIVLYLNQE